ncbi:MAG: putative toxin-antitoxin system toxin component, PIN family [Solirubrobacterales bacterium]
MRSVLDVNVLIAALLSPHGAPADIIRLWLAGRFELVVSERLLTELERALRYEKVRERIPAPDAARFVSLLRIAAPLVRDPPEPARRSRDPDDDYLIALAEQERALLVSGDRDLLALAGELPIRSPREFLEALESLD